VREGGGAPGGKALRIGGRDGVVVVVVSAVRGRDFYVAMREGRRGGEGRTREFGLRRIYAFLNSRSEVMQFCRVVG
jgi:hypothetical protein